MAGEENDNSDQLTRQKLPSLQRLIAIKEKWVLTMTEESL